MAPAAILNNGVEEQNGTGVYQYSPQALNIPRPAKVIIIGSGVSCIAAVKLFKEHFLGKPTQLVVYEKNADVGGTWLENRYPGCSCDVPSHGYTFSWEGNPYWSKAYVGAEEIFRYFQGRAKEYGVYDYVKLQHRVVGAHWDQDAGRWKVEVEDLVSHTRLVDEAEVVINASGFLNKWAWPSIPGIMDFKGHLVHSASWDNVYSFEGKTVCVIGSGSSAIQIVPQIQPVAKHLVSVNRSPSWITPEFGEKFAKDGRDTKFPKELQDFWAGNPEAFLKYRKEVENDMNHLFDLHYKGSKVQTESLTMCKKNMEQKLLRKPELAAKLIPDFAVGCRRVTPGHGYLEALAADNVTVLTNGIRLVREDGFETDDGQFFKVDAIICATGFDTSFKPNFPLVGRHSKDLRDVWADEPESYLSIAVPDFPNYFVLGGPNFTLANGVFIPSIEVALAYIYQAIEKIQSENIKSMSPKLEAMADFQEHKDSLMRDLVWTSGCRSWYKNGHVEGRVWGPWCGSSLHFMEIMKQVRWEDWDIEHRQGNRFRYFGNGKTQRELHGLDLSYYLSERGRR